jgi:beta-glucanase (GH16 family)
VNNTEEAVIHGFTSRPTVGQHEHTQRPSPGPLASRLLPKGLVLVGALAALTVVSMLVAAGVFEARPHGLTGTWSLVFSDEFDGNSLDRTKWEPNRYGKDGGGDAPFNPSADDAWFSRENVRVRDGKLVLTLKREPRTLEGKTFAYSSGVVQTEQHFLVKPGSYIEARLKVPKCDGCWPAFWTAAPNVWPPELDILEFFGTDTQARPAFNYHPPKGRPVGPIEYGNGSVDYTTSYHVYGMLWDGYKAVPRLDGERYPGTRGEMTQLAQALILNLSVQTGHTPPPGSEMRVDWVRVWRPGGSE